MGTVQYSTVPVPVPVKRHRGSTVPYTVKDRANLPVPVSRNDPQVNAIGLDHPLRVYIRHDHADPRRSKLRRDAEPLSSERQVSHCGHDHIDDRSQTVPDCQTPTSLHTRTMTRTRLCQYGIQ